MADRRDDRDTVPTRDKEGITITVNARERVIPPGRRPGYADLSFGEVVRLAFDSPPSGPDIEFTVSYRDAAGRSPDGALLEGQSVTVKNGTVFNVSFTDRS